MSNFSAVHVIFFGLVVYNVLLATGLQALDEYSQYLARKDASEKLRGVAELQKLMKTLLTVGEILIVPSAVAFVIYVVVP